MIDHWTEQLQCPKCRKTGMAGVCQSGVDMPVIEAVPAGFMDVTTRLGPGFHCSTCNIAVRP
jgi:hypothetical protein